jgi:methylase of polypeptide subunit release factors
MHHIEVSHQGARLVLEFEDDVYQPGNLTGILADIMDIKSGDRVADVGCGTGYLAIVAALLGAAEVVGIDPEPNAIHWTAHNAQLNSVPNVSVLLGGALDPVEHLRFDVILTLPPQMPFPTNFNPWRWGGTDGTDVILRIIDQARTTLHRGGRAGVRSGRARKALTRAHGLSPWSRGCRGRTGVHEGARALLPYLVLPRGAGGLSP